MWSENAETSSHGSSTRCTAKPYFAEEYSSQRAVAVPVSMKTEEDVFATMPCNETIISVSCTVMSSADMA